MELPRHVHKHGGVGQGGESRIVSTEAELDAAVADGWVVDPNAGPDPSVTALTERELAALVTVANMEPIADTSVAYEPIPDVLDDPDGVPPAEEPEGEDAAITPTEPVVKRKPGRPRKA